LVLTALAQFFWLEARKCLLNVLSAAGPGDLAAAVTTRGAAHDDSPWLV